MKILLICIGKTGYQPFRECIERYTKRIPHYCPFELREIPDIRNTRNMTEARQKQQEGELLLSALTPGDFLMLLDERGREYTSREFSRLIEEKMISLPDRLVFAVGGPYGFSDEVYARANGKLSLSKMTYPHELVRIFFVEQIYRAFTIMKGEPYHHD